MLFLMAGKFKAACSSALPVKFERQLHLARRVEQVAVADQAPEALARNIRRSSAEADAVESVKRLGAEVHPHLLADRKALRDRDVLVVIGELPYFRIVTGGVSETIQRRTGALQREGTRAVRYQEIVHRRIEGATLGGRPPAIIGGDVRNAASCEQRQRVGC